MADFMAGDGLDRLSLNVWTTKGWSLREAVDGCVRAGVPGIGLWRDKVAEVGLDEAAQLIHRSGLTVTSLCRGGFFTGDAAQRAAAAAGNRRAVAEARALGTDVLVLVVGGLPAGSTDLAGARLQVAEGIAALAPYAAEHGVRLAIEPLHPMFCADRAVLSTLGQALDLAAQIEPDGAAAPTVGVCLDSYHVWWDPQLLAQIGRAGPRILAFQVSDFLVPIPPDALLGRGHLGDGVIDIPALTRAVLAAGYDGLIEVEIFNQQVWDAPGEQTLRTVIDRHRRYLSGITGAGRPGPC
jgi:sugar phosphate isomerase/epimerase